MSRLVISDRTATVLYRALEKLRLWEGLGADEQAAVCALRGVAPTERTHAPSVVRAFAEQNPPDGPPEPRRRWFGGAWLEPS